jgi:hypothetical protein
VAIGAGIFSGDDFCLVTGLRTGHHFDDSDIEENDEAPSKTAFGSRMRKDPAPAVCRAAAGKTFQMPAAFHQYSSFAKILGLAGSFLSDRRDAQRRWKVTQVDELLSASTHSDQSSAGSTFNKE